MVTADEEISADLQAIEDGVGIEVVPVFDQETVEDQIAEAEAEIEVVEEFPSDNEEETTDLPDDLEDEQEYELEPMDVLHSLMGDMTEQANMQAHELAESVAQVALDIGVNVYDLDYNKEDVDDMNT